LIAADQETENPEVSTFAGSGSSGSTDATGTSAKFYYPRAITTDGTNLYVVDTNNHTIRKIVISTGAVTTFEITILRIV
jgi:DNA-binding beta-propeller fold protein YncE